MAKVYCDSCGKQVDTASHYVYRCKKCGYKTCSSCHEYTCSRCGSIYDESIK